MLFWSLVNEPIYIFKLKLQDVDIGPSQLQPASKFGKVLQPCPGFEFRQETGEGTTACIQDAKLNPQNLTNTYTEDILNSILPPREYTTEKQQLWY